MDKFVIHFMNSWCDLINGSGAETDHISGGFPSQLNIMVVGVNKTFKDCLQQEMKIFMIGNTDKMKVRGEFIVD